MRESNLWTFVCKVTFLRRRYGVKSLSSPHLNTHRHNVRPLLRQPYATVNFTRITANCNSILILSLTSAKKKKSGTMSKYSQHSDSDKIKYL